LGVRRCTDKGRKNTVLPYGGAGAEFLMTKLSKLVKNNPEKFLEGYIFKLSSSEKLELVKNFHRFFSSLKRSAVLPTAFTEKGLYMLATILKSPHATETTIAIVETFAKIREFGKAVSQLPYATDEKAQKALMQRSGKLIAELLDDNIMEVSGDETTIELNLAALKIKHTVKRDKKNRNDVL